MRDVVLFPPKSQEGWNDLVKTELMRDGAVGTFMYWDEDVQCYDEETFGYYYGGPVQVNHCVDIVGWDDDFPKTDFVEGGSPRSDGAWLIRNSWGAAWATEGTSGSPTTTRVSAAAPAPCSPRPASRTDARQGLRPRPAGPSHEHGFANVTASDTSAGWPRCIARCAKGSG